MAKKYLDLEGLKKFFNLFNAKKADVDSPNLTGTPTAPTATEGSKSTQIANTEFVSSAVSNLHTFGKGIQVEDETISFVDYNATK